MANFEYNGRKLTVLAGPKDDDSDPYEIITGICGIAKVLNRPLFEQITDNEVAFLVPALAELASRLYDSATVPVEIELLVQRGLDNPATAVTETSYSDLSDASDKLADAVDDTPSNGLTDSDRDDMGMAALYVSKAQSILTRIQERHG